jgi:hypothetical protein
MSAGDAVWAVIWQHASRTEPGSHAVNARLLLVSVPMLCLAACAAAPGRVSITAQATGITSVPLPLGETRSGGEPLIPVMPPYPPVQQAAYPAMQEVEVAIRVDATGRVQDVIGIEVDMELPPWEIFFAAVRTSVLQWRFEPLRVDHWAGDAAGNAHAVDSKTRRFEQRYRFDFACHGGKTSVTGEAEGQAYPR